jgi:hypothetical protein
MFFSQQRDVSTLPFVAVSDADAGKIQAALCDFSHPDAAFRGRIVWWLARLCNAGLLIDSGWANLSCGLLRRKSLWCFCDFELD